MRATLNREIGFISSSSSFSFRAWCACEQARRRGKCVQGAECSSSRWPRLWEVLLLFEASLNQDVVHTLVLKQNGSKSVARQALCVCFTNGFIKVLHKTVYMA